jgi:hypothetical protein
MVFASGARLMEDRRRKWTDEDIDLVMRLSAEGQTPGQIAQLLEGRTPTHVSNLKRVYSLAKVRQKNWVYYYIPTPPKLTLARCSACGADVSLPCPVPRCSRYSGSVEQAGQTLAGVTANW